MVTKHVLMSGAFTYPRPYTNITPFFSFLTRSFIGWFWQNLIAGFTITAWQQHSTCHTK